MSQWTASCPVCGTRFTGSRDYVNNQAAICAEADRKTGRTRRR